MLAHHWQCCYLCAAPSITLKVCAGSYLSRGRQGRAGEPSTSPVQSGTPSPLRRRAQIRGDGHACGRALRHLGADCGGRTLTCLLSLLFLSFPLLNNQTLCPCKSPECGSGAIVTSRAQHQHHAITRRGGAEEVSSVRPRPLYYSTSEVDCQDIATLLSWLPTMYHVNKSRYTKYLQ